MSLRNHISSLALEYRVYTSEIIIMEILRGAKSDREYNMLYDDFLHSDRHFNMLAKHASLKVLEV
ncbi:MAG TPA: hypothetical protein DEP99_05345 [Nitrospiraceae bacterium]|nr:hypothetical protein [Nitrospiraceae bacterium]